MQTRVWYDCGDGLLAYKAGNKNTRDCGAASLDRIVTMPDEENENKRTLRTANDLPNWCNFVLTSNDAFFER